ncbi:MAG: sporulation protein YqfD, partial [Clostridiales bacterium]|nr:sporulation protein YqfD [Clostridiales bacterium]
MLRFIKFFHGYLHVRIRGYSPERFLNLCSRMNIVLWGLLPTEDGYRFCISRKAFGMIEPALEKTGTQIEVERRVGLPFLARKYRNHVFFLAGLCLAGFLLCFLSLFIWKVEVEGNFSYSTQTILEFLDQNGAGYASAKSGIDCEALENMLRAEFEDIIWVSASIRGTRLYLVVQERLAGSSDAGETQEAAATDLIASNRGVVESITVRSGTPLVGVGDTVEAGDVLVTGALEIVDDSGETAAYHFVSSDADVAIRTALSYEDTFSASYEKKILTGDHRGRLTVCLESSFLPLGRP